MGIDQFCVEFSDAVDFPVRFDFIPETRYKELKLWDSLAALGIVLLFDTQFSITLTGDHFEKYDTVQELYDFAMGK